MTTIESTSTHETPGPITNGVVNGQKLTKMRRPKAEASHGEADTIQTLRSARMKARAELVELERRARDLRQELGDDVSPDSVPAEPRRSVVGLTPLNPKVRASTKTGGNIAKKATAKKAAPAVDKAKAPRLARRTDEQISASLTRVVEYLADKTDGRRAEDIRAALDLDVREVPRILKEGIETKALRSQGQKRATTYFAA